MGTRVKGTARVTTDDGAEYVADIIEKTCPCSPGLKVKVRQNELGFINGLTPSLAQELVRQKGWKWSVQYDG